MHRDTLIHLIRAAGGSAVVMGIMIIMAAYERFVTPKPRRICSACEKLCLREEMLFTERVEVMKGVIRDGRPGKIFQDEFKCVGMLAHTEKSEEYFVADSLVRDRDEPLPWLTAP